MIVRPIRGNPRKIPHLKPRLTSTGRLSVDFNVVQTVDHAGFARLHSDAEHTSIGAVSGQEPPFSGSTRISPERTVANSPVIC